jgi:hypothetical protein
MEIRRCRRRKSGTRRTLSVECLESRRLLTVAPTPNIVPKAVVDEATTTGNVPVLVAVIANDYDRDGSIDPATVEIMSSPKAGQVRVFGDGTVEYVPPPNRFGTDDFSYRVKDDLGAASNSAMVSITVRSIWQNPDNNVDVDADGAVAPSDILLIINQLNGSGSEMLEHPPDPLFAPPPFVDVNGDGYITPLDAIAAINCLNSGASGGCPIEPVPMVVSDDPADSPSDIGVDEIPSEDVANDSSEGEEAVHSEYPPLASGQRAKADVLLVVAEDVAATRAATSHDSPTTERDSLFRDGLDHPLLQDEIDPLVDLF